jgi:hypothetical protein
MSFLRRGFVVQERHRLVIFNLVQERHRLVIFMMTMSFLRRGFFDIVQERHQKIIIKMTSFLRRGFLGIEERKCLRSSILNYN